MIEFLKSNFNIKFKNALPLLEKIKKNSYDAYFVGGCVRDFMLNRNFYDIDITTSATPDEIKKIFNNVIDTGIKHGTVTVINKGIPYEITTFRSEGNYINHRFPEKVFFEKSISQDLERRDFTINAMALDIKGDLIDLHSGILDIKRKLIRTVNNPDERFNEDALRMLRAFRFSSMLNFIIEKDTYDSICKNKKLIEYISIERIVNELRKLFMGENNYNSFDLLIKSGLNVYIPFFKYVKHITNFSNFNFNQIIFYLLVKNSIETQELKKLKLSNKDYKEIKDYLKISNLIKNSNLINRIIFDFSKEKVIFVLIVIEYFNEKDIEKIKKIILPINSFSDVNITNREIIDTIKIKKPGPWIKNIKDKIIDNILLNNLENDNYKIKDFISRIGDL